MSLSKPQQRRAAVGVCLLPLAPLPAPASAPQRARWQVAAVYLSAAFASISRTLIWSNGGTVSITRTLIWSNGGVVSVRRRLTWTNHPSPNQVEWALTGRSRPVTFSLRFEKRTKTNQFLADISHMVPDVAGWRDNNNDRAVIGAAGFELHPDLRNARGELVPVNPLTDYVAIIYRILVGSEYWLDLPLGLFRLSIIGERVLPGPPGSPYRIQEVAASDLSSLLEDYRFPEPHRVEAGQNYISGTGAIRDLLDLAGVSHSLPGTEQVTTRTLEWDTGETVLRAVNDLAAGINHQPVAFDANGRAVLRRLIPMDQRTPDQEYTGDEFGWVTDEGLLDQSDQGQIYNRVIVVTNDPEVYGVAENHDPESPISIENLGRVASAEPIHIESLPTVEAAEERARRALEQYSTLYVRRQIVTPLDPRRGPQETYRLRVDGVDPGTLWWVRNWTMDLTLPKEGQAPLMRHTVAQIQRVG